MSRDDLDISDTIDGTEDVWKKMAEQREVLEMCVEEDIPFADRAEKLLERLEEEGY